MTEAHAERAHATLAPSAANRWMNCPGSIRLGEGIPSTSSVYARHGTAAHELAALCLSKMDVPATYAGMVIDSVSGDVEITAVPADGDRYFEVDDEMVDAVQIYLDAVLENYDESDGDELVVEEKLDMTHIHPAIWGTGDAAVYKPKIATLRLFDFKYGQGVMVSPESNPQALLYAAGMARRYHNRALSQIELTIVQPRSPGATVKTWPLDILLLFQFEEIAKTAALATEEPNAELSAGDWCQFCPAIGICPEIHSQAVKTAELEFSDVGGSPLPDVTTFDPDKMAEKLKQVPLLKLYLKGLEEFAHGEALHGRGPTGFKLVANRAIRRWKDEAEARTFVAGLGIKPAEMEIAKFKSPAQMEKMLGKRKAEIVPLVVKESSGSLLVEESDPREALKADVLSDFTAQ